MNTEIKGLRLVSIEENLTEKELKLKEKYGDEKVLVVERASLPLTLKTKEFTYTNDRVLSYISEASYFVPRYKAEYNPQLRQPISYIVIKADGKYFATKRLAGSGEERLVSQISIGVGGHINPIDEESYYDIFYTSLLRELDEELTIPKLSSPTIDFVGIINDTSNEVSKDHLGLLYILDFDIPVEEITVKETDKLEGIYMTLDEMGERYSTLESWSQIVYREVLKNWCIE